MPSYSFQVYYSQGGTTNTKTYQDEATARSVALSLIRGGWQNVTVLKVEKIQLEVVA